MTSSASNMPVDLFSLQGRVAIVTGALGLLGQQHCRALTEAGASVVVCDLDGDKCRALAETLGPRAIGIGVDITNPDSIGTLKDETLKRYQKLDILVNNAAINDAVEHSVSKTDVSQFENYALSHWKKSIDVNVTGNFLCNQILGTEMTRRGSGSIIQIASTYGIVAPDQRLYRDAQGNQTFYKAVSYPVSKAAILSMTRYLAAYWGGTGVRINALSPGGVENGQDDFFIASYAARTPMGRMARPTDYKGALIFLASDASGYMNGANLVVDGGWTIW